MQIEEINTSEGRKRYLSFRRKLYCGDKSYVSTSEFVLIDILYRKTNFCLACNILPIIISDNATDVAEAIIIYNDRFPYLQIAFFEALEGQQAAVDILLNFAQIKAREFDVKGVIVGLNAHISYGVGILSRGFEYKNSFDSIYSKSYYPDYFKGMKKQTLSTYKRNRSELDDKLPKEDFNIRICRANIINFKEETERMRCICEKTIANTFLYYPTEKYHFYDLMKSMKPFLKDENLLFAQDKCGNDIGFVFWHPDYNQMLSHGKYNSIMNIAVAYIFNKRKIDTVKINALGSLSPKATIALINEISNITGDRYTYAETNFVWDNNLPSTLLNRKLFGDAHRKYEVYFSDEIEA